MQALTHALVGLVLLLQLACAAAAEKPAPFPATHSYSEIFAAMEETRERAARENKLALYVMGANWCHDSLDFVAKTRSAEFSALLDQRYVVQLINIGDLEFIREIITRYGEPVIYGTPTVLVVEPVSNTLLNRDSLPYWRNAEAISEADTLSYFTAFYPGQTPIAGAEYSPALAMAMTDIDTFESEQAERIYRAYADLGAMFKAGEGNDKPSAEFIAKWKNLAAMRGQITGDLENLRTSASEQAEAGVDPIALDFPHYELFIDAS